MSNLNSFISENSGRFLEELKDFLRIPSISTASEHDGDCRRAADWLADHLQQLGIRKVDLLGSESHPVVWAEGPEAPGKPTVLVYGHYDVQPPDPLDLWKTPPFEPTVRGGNLYARGTSDDKGQVFSIIKGFEAATRTSEGPPLNIRYIIEGQEETGSDVIFDLLKREPDRVKADAVLVADMPYYARGIPAIYTALRGICYVEIKVRVLAGDLHSGLYGGVAPNAHEVLVQLLGRLKTKDGKIHIPGLYEAVEKPSRAELNAWKRLPLDRDRYLKKEVGARELVGYPGKSVFERLWALPTFEIHGIRGGFTAAGAKTVIPAEATAKVSLRLVPGQKSATVARQLRAAVKTLTPEYATASVTVIHGGDPVEVDISRPPFQVLAEAFRKVEGRAPVPIRSGGSIPIVPALQRKRAPVLLAGIGLPDDGLHAPNEKLGVNQFKKGIKVFAGFFQSFGAT